MKKQFSICLLLAVGSACVVRGATPQLLNYQGRIAISGTNYDGTGQFKFALISGTSSETFWSCDGGSYNGSEPSSAVPLPVSKGLFSVQLGDVTLPNMVYSIPATVFTNSDVRLRVWFSDGVNGFNRLTPDQRITSVGYSMNAAQSAFATTAGTANGIAPDVNITARSLNVGTNNTVGGYFNSVSGGASNSISEYASYVNIAGGLSNSVSGYTASFSAIGGGANNSITAPFATISGGKLNKATAPGASIGGGGTDGTEWSDPNFGGNLASGVGSTIAGGLANQATNQWAAIGGGAFNIANFVSTIAGGMHNEATGYFASVGGGNANRSTDNFTTIAGGENNSATSQSATIGGGSNNIATNMYATVAGGVNNIASGVGSFVGGGGIIYSGSGDANIASGGASTVAAGMGNTATRSGSAVLGGAYNQAAGEYSFVGGGRANKASGPGASVAGGGWNGEYGQPNTASGIAASVAGGIDNTASGDFSTVPGGARNSAVGQSSFAAGFDAHAQHDGTFVWSDTSRAFGGNFGSTRSNQFLISASGGIGINTAWTPEGGVVIAENVFINQHDLLLREEDHHHGLGWYGSGKAFTSSFEPDGPVLYGNGGGALATIGTTKKIALSWDQNSVDANQPFNVLAGMTVDGGLTLKSDFSLNDKDVYFRRDHNHGLGWYGPQKGFGGDESIDGPVLYGASGGALGVASTPFGFLTSLKWDSGGVTFPGELKANGRAEFSEGVRTTWTGLGIPDYALFVADGAVEIHGHGDVNVSRENIHFTGNVSVWGALEVFGLKLFVEPHPSDTNQEIAYVTLEGPEAGTYIRGTSAVNNGEAVIVLPEHYSLVTSDQGVTVQLTPRGDYLQLYVTDSNPRQVTVREAQGKSGKFDYLVQGVRKAYENYQPVRTRKTTSGATP